MTPHPVPSLPCHNSPLAPLSDSPSWTNTLLALGLPACMQASIQVSISTQRQTRSQSATLGSGRTTGVRASGRRTQPSIRRTRSQWELVDSDEDILPSIVVRK
ncbi:hypothetical protein AUP68_08513 [Ilyonectria robusta]